jgi:cell division protein FtsW (lipid II flippase)
MLHFGQRNRINKDRSTKALLGRFIMALFGGVALVGPMLLMVLHNDLATTLSTASIAVFLFAAVVAFGSAAPPEVLVGAVAAYAAVMVVFVGAKQ